MENLNKQKDLGNQFFKEKKYNEALQIFTKACQQIQKIQSKQFLISTTELSKLYVILLINSAFACINIKSEQAYIKAIDLCTKAINIDPKNVKALFRRGLARKQYAQQLQKRKGVTEDLLTDYTFAKADFQKVNIIQRTNQLALQKFNQTVKDIYRVTIALNKKIDFKNSQQTVKEENFNQIKVNTYSNPYQNNSNIKKKGVNMQKIMEQYKVFQVSEIAKKKVNQNYLERQLPKTRAQLQKAIRQIKQSQDIFLSFVYRFNSQYLVKIQPTFDMLTDLVNIILKKGSGQNAKACLQILKNCKSFNLYWKSLVTKQKSEFIQKWRMLGLQESLLN